MQRLRSLDLRPMNYTWAFADDDFVALNSYVSSETLLSNNLIVQAITEFQLALTGL